jgi:hypothetical protein
MVSFKIFISIAALVTAVAAVPFPEALAQLPGATMDCHNYCGNLILESRKCNDNECLCADGSPFMELVPDCLDCGWQLWNYYGKFLIEPLGKCNLPTEPTGINTKTAVATTSAVSAKTSASSKTTAASAETSASVEFSAPPAQTTTHASFESHSSSQNASSTHLASSNLAASSVSATTSKVASNTMAQVNGIAAVAASGFIAVAAGVVAGLF